MRKLPPGVAAENKRARERQRYAASPAEHRSRRNAYYAANRHKWRETRLRKYGLSLMDYDALLEAQGFACAICDTASWETRDGYLHVDHDHRTGEVRGLLCHSCNVGLGHFRDDPVLLAGAVKYLLDRRM